MQNIQDSFPLRQPEKAHLQSYKTAWLLFGGVLLSLQTPRQEPAEVPAASTPPAVGPGCPLATSPPAACRDTRVPACLWPGAPKELLSPAVAVAVPRAVGNVPAREPGSTSPYKLP